MVRGATRREPTVWPDKFEMTISHPRGFKKDFSKIDDVVKNPIYCVAAIFCS
jgi:hypothetical protein